jgi:signal transduction histidine kinase
MPSTNSSIADDAAGAGIAQAPSAASSTAHVGSSGGDGNGDGIGAAPHRRRRRRRPQSRAGTTREGPVRWSPRAPDNGCEAPMTLSIPETENRSRVEPAFGVLASASENQSRCEPAFGVLASERENRSRCEPASGVLAPAIAAATVLSMAAAGAPDALIAAAVAGVVAMAQHLRARAHGRRAGARVDRLVQAAVRTREEVLANTAHELRTPLTALATALELLRDGGPMSHDDAAMFLDQASVASRHLAFLVNDIVDLAALESGRLTLDVRERSAHELLFEAAQVMSLTAQARGVGLHIAAPADDLAVLVDSGRFLQIAFNLLANAIKFSAPDGRVELLTVAAGRTVRFEVHDSGPGIAPAERGRLFQRFGRLPAHGRPAIAGTGLGLHVCKLLVEAMQGTIGYRPGEPRGSVFWFDLPRAEAPAAADGEVALRERSSA